RPFERQAGLGSIERLDLALLVNRQDDGVRRRIDIETDDIPQFADEVWIPGELELADPMRFETMSAPDALHVSPKRPLLSPSSLPSSTSPRRAGPGVSWRRSGW